MNNLIIIKNLTKILLNKLILYVLILLDMLILYIIILSNVLILYVLILIILNQHFSHITTILISS